MTWRDHRNLGPWRFKKQKNKWAYLNNPRWLATPRPFQSGGPDDYDGRGGEEPQVWDPPLSAVQYPSASTKHHHQCGHWHLQPAEAGWGPSPPPPLIEGPWWQPSLDVWKEENSIGIACRQWLDEADIIGAYKGIIAEDGSIGWSPSLSYASNSVITEPPLRLVTQCLLHYSFALEETYPAPTWMFGNYNGHFFMEQVFEAHEWQSQPGWEEFDMHSNGRAVVITSTDEDGLRLRLSSDYGQTWGPKIVIDWLYNFLGEEDYLWQWHYSSGMCVQCDEYTGAFYLLLSYFDTDTWEQTFLLLKSVNYGTNWTFVADWPDPDGIYMSDLCSLAVSDEHLYVSLLEYVDSHAVVFSSANDGSSWTEHDFGPNYFVASVAANRNVAIAYMPLFDPYAKSWIAQRTANSGSSWSQILRINATGAYYLPALICKGVVYAGYRNIRASGELFALTFCGAIFPTDRYEWIDQDGITHDMLGEPGEVERICFWLSRDNAETWELKLAPFQGWKWW